jgi:hypothetical protein
VVRSGWEAALWSAAAGLAQATVRRRLEATTLLATSRRVISLPAPHLARQPPAVAREAAAAAAAAEMEMAATAAEMEMAAPAAEVEMMERTAAAEAEAGLPPVAPMS